MIFGRWINRLACSTTLWALLLTGVASAATTPAQVESIIRSIETVRDTPIAFAEHRTNRLLTEPLMLTGTIRFSTDGTLSKHIDEPFNERVTISARQVELQREGKTRRLSLNRRPDIKAFYVGIQALLAGDAATLFESFNVTLTENGEHWRLELTPKQKKLRKFVANMVISGVAAQVRTVRTVQTDGNWQEMSFQTSTD